MKAPEERSEDEKMALLGRPKLGEIFRAQIRIKESKEFKNTVDKLVQRANASIILGERDSRFFTVCSFLCLVSMHPMNIRANSILE